MLTGSRKKNLTDKQNITTEEYTKFYHFCDVISHKPNNVIIAAITKILRKNPEILFNYKFELIDLEDNVHETTLIGFAIYTSNCFVLKALFNFVKNNEENRRIFLAEVHNFAAICHKETGFFNIQPYDVACTELVEALVAGNARVIENRKERLSVLRQKLPLAFHVPQQVSFLEIVSIHEAENLSREFEGESRAIGQHIWDNNRAIAEFIDNPPRANSIKRCSPHSEVVLPVQNPNPQTPEELLQQCKEETRHYISSVQGQPQSLAEQFEELDVTDEEKEFLIPGMQSYEDPFTLELIEVPVTFEGIVFDWKSIIKNFKREGKKFVPFAPHDSRKFLLKELEPGRVALAHMQEMIDLVKRTRAAKGVKQMLKSHTPEVFLLEACRTNNLSMLKACLERAKSNPEVHEVFHAELRKGLYQGIKTLPINDVYIQTCLDFFGDELANISIGSDQENSSTHLPFLFAVIDHAPIELAQKILSKLRSHINMTINETSLMHRAVLRNSPALIRTLLESGCTQIDSQDKDGNTPLIVSAKRNLPEVMKVLVEEGNANPNIVNVKKKAALHYVTMMQTLIVPKHIESATILARAKGLSMQSISIFKPVNTMPATVNVTDMQPASHK